AQVSLRTVNQPNNNTLGTLNSTTQSQRGPQEAPGGAPQAQQGNTRGNGNNGAQNLQIQGGGGGGRGQSQESTGDDGTFTFNNVTPGNYRITVERDGYIRQDYGQRTWTGPGTIITIAAGQRLNSISLQLVPAGTIAGKITDDHGEPVAGIQVQALTYN